MGENSRSLRHEGKTLLNPVNFFWILKYMAVNAAIPSPRGYAMTVPAVGVTFYGPYQRTIQARD